ncbi:MAG TPA: class I SAM-dependent methyltransferase [Ohtaekwangia sp.]
MELTVAARLLEGGIEQTHTRQVWADFGSGKGLFTEALSTLLPEQSKIYAIDKDGGALHGIESKRKNISIEKVRKDFVHDKLDIELLDGIIMANALHFVENKVVFMNTVRCMLKPAAHVILIEYDTDHSNPWVPYPISFHSLIGLVKEIGFSEVIKLDEEPSIYERANMYSALMKI